MFSGRRCACLKFKLLIFPLVFGTALALFTVYALLDTFVIERVYDPYAEASLISEAGSSESPAGTGESGEVVLNETSAPQVTETPDPGATQDPGVETSLVVVTKTTYIDDNIEITVSELRIHGTDVHVADIKLSSPEYLKTAFAKGKYGRNVSDETSDTAERVNAILAINGDYYGARTYGYVIRNGVLYRSTGARNREDLVIYADGSFEIINESKITAAELMEKGAVQVLSFGPGLIVDGEIAVDENDEVGLAKANNPRTAIGIIDELHYVFVVSDGRTDTNEGLSLLELAEIMKDLGAKTAYNLDGGGSSTLYFNGEVINAPTTGGSVIQERKVSDIVYIGY